MVDSEDKVQDLDREFDRLFRSLKIGAAGGRMMKEAPELSHARKCGCRPGAERAGVYHVDPINTVAGPDNPNPAIHYMNTT
jgi:hypothetical protein